MGLPLFIAPVESDLPSKAAGKTSTTAPPRSSIRRTRTTGRVADRADRRRILRHFEILEQSGQYTGLRGQPPPWIDAELPPDDDLTARPLRDVLRDMNASDEHRRDRVEEHLHSLFRDGSSASVNHPDSSASSSHERTRDTARSSVPLWPTRDDDIRRLPPFAPSNTGDFRATIRAHLASQNQNQVRLPPQSAPRRDRHSDGLGDRERSLSPEVWDTLLSTLTPDPQPPSAGSSFASNMASQSAGATSSTSFTAPDLAQDTAIDQACESGCEGSETEEPNPAQAILNRIRRRREEMRRVRVRMPGVEPDNPFNRPASRDSGAVGSDSRHRRSPDGPVVDHLRRARSIRDRTNHNGYNRARQAWVGHLSVGNSDDEQGPERTRRSQESPAASGSNTHSREEDWMSMQRIVQSMARREDIPDEWWAGAGLSRTLPGDGTE
ncbi:hypothetical protein FSPOR_7749 [Fusarium sporotrichioides]|jgi:hypothetical protein|uniref:Uncharacterized protein n=1 Tax=Fusarium sporotrichioides TaxID=5514 RepID=A0A395RXF3_FUSSP|nr:hypothetical protein FSPOR_7749 [Fusarium sporotrichioides]